MSLNVSLKIEGGRELARRLKEIDRGIVKKATRGAVGEAANVIRDKARANAYSVGLGQTGPTVTPSGRTINLRGGIPQSIKASVEKNQGTKAIAKTFVAPYGSLSGRGSLFAGNQFNWIWIEFGSVHNSPRSTVAMSCGPANKAMRSG